MPAQIENGQFAYKGEAAWHGLGTQVNADATGNEMLQVAGLAWTVKRRQLAMRSAIAGDARMLTEPLSGFRAIVRTDTDKVFQVASDRYQPVQNAEIVDFFREFCDAGHASMETVGALRDGAVIWALAKLNSGSTTVLAGGDELRARLLLATSHDGSLRTIAKKVNERVVCGNTLTLALSESGGQWTLKHSSKFGDAQKADAKRVMSMAIEDAIHVNEIASQLSKVPIDQGDWMEFMGNLLGKENVLAKPDSPLMSGEDAIFWNEFVSGVVEGHVPESAELSRIASEIQESTMTSPGSNLESARGTLWGAVNGVTHYVDHVARARSDSNRLFSAWFGDGERMKNSAVRVAAEMAGISLQSR